MFAIKLNIDKLTTIAYEPLLLSVESDDSEYISRGYSSSTDGSYVGVKDKCDHEDGLFGVRDVTCFCDEDLCNGSTTAAASAITVAAASVAAANALRQ